MVECNLEVLNSMIQEQKNEYENKILKLETKLERIKEYLEKREDIAKSMNELQTIQGIYNILEGE